MRVTLITTTALLLGLGGLAGSQDTSNTQQEDDVTRPVRTLRVLQSPYDLAAYYGSGPGRPSGLPPVPDDPAYALASFYRTRQIGSPFGTQPGPWLWPAFWTGGYGAPCPTPFLGYRRSIGENGDLFLAVPFLAPVGPLNGSFAGN